MFRFACLLLLSVLWLAIAQANADQYTTHVKPLLAEKCIACHGPLRSEAGLRLDAAVLIRKGSQDNAVVSLTAPHESLMLERIKTTDSSQQMPPKGEGVPLKADEIALLEKWISAGMPAPEDETYVASPQDHWAYRSIERPPLPDAIGAAVDAGPIDRWLSSLQYQRGLSRVPATDQATWLRRVTLDLTGLPPTVDQIDDFLSSDAPDARERVVDRLLATPEHAERWGRHWMDVWRYSDWDGYKAELRGSQRHIWHWRDWIIESISANKPYDQMIVEMLAADEIAPGDLGACAPRVFWLATIIGPIATYGWMQRSSIRQSILGYDHQLRALSRSQIRSCQPGRILQLPRGVRAL